MTDVSSEAAVQAILARAEGRFQESRQELFAATDRLFSFLMVGQWVFALGLALWVSPWAWAGKVKTVHPHVWAALVLGAVLSSLPIALAWMRPGWVVTRH